MLPSFLSGTDQKKQKQTRGVFDNNIYNVTRGTKVIYEAVKEYFVANTPVEYHVQGRFNIVKDSANTTTTTNEPTTTTSSVTRIMSNSMLICIGVMLKIWNP